MLGWLLTLIVSPSAAAPPLEQGPPVDARLWMDAGWDPTWRVGVGGGWALPTPKAHWDRAEVSAVVSVPLVLPSEGQAFWVGASGRLGQGWPRLGGGVATGLTRAHNELGEQLGWSMEGWLRPTGVFGRWTTAVELGWRQGLATHMRHASAVEELFEDRPSVSGRSSPVDGPQDGWVAAPVERFRALGLVGATLSPRWGLELGGGLEMTLFTLGIPANPSIGQLPFLFQLRGVYQWTANSTR